MLHKVIIPTLHDRQNELCNGYFGRMRRDDHKLNKVLPDTRMVSYALRLYNELPFPMANTNRYKKKHDNTMVVGTLSTYLNGLSSMV